jgi:hypothetical protein
MDERVADFTPRGENLKIELTVWAVTHSVMEAEAIDGDCGSVHIPFGQCATEEFGELGMAGSALVGFP